MVIRPRFIGFIGTLRGTHVTAWHDQGRSSFKLDVWSVSGSPDSIGKLKRDWINIRISFNEQKHYQVYHVDGERFISVINMSTGSSASRFMG